MPGNELTTVLQRLLGGIFQPAAARYLHTNHGEAFDVILAEDVGELFGVVSGVQFWASDEGDAVFDEILVEVGIGISGTIGSDEQIGALKVWGIHRGQFDLHWPLG